MDSKYSVFEEKSTYKHDYKIPKLEEVKRYHQWTHKPKTVEKILKQKPYNPKDVHTMQPWADSEHKIPFDLLLKQKPITQTHPQFIFGKCSKPEDSLKWDIIKTRPRLYVSPAVSMDDINDKELREILCHNMYTTVWEKATSELDPKFLQREVPNTTFEKNAAPVQGNFFTYKPLPLEWKKKGKEWETKQLTTLVDPTCQFWLRYKNKFNTPVGRDPFKHTLSEENRKEIRDLIEKDELRMSYDKLKPGYAGYVPRFVTGPLRKQELDAVKI